jgi:O-antigen/teichoic acid export membrane protein
LYFAAEPIIALAYGGRDFEGSVLVMRIILPVLLLQMVTSTLGQVLYSRRRERVTLWIVAIVVAFNLVAAVALTYAFDLVGAAVSVLLTWIVNGWLHVIATRGCFTDETGGRLRWGAALVGPIAVAAGIVAVGQALSGEAHVVVTSLAASVFYVAAWAAVVFASCRRRGGISQRFLVPLRESESKAAA